MKKIFLLLSISIAISSCSEDSVTSSEENSRVSYVERNLSSENDKISYYLGYTYFEILKKASFYNDLNHELLLKGFVSSFSMDTLENLKMSEYITKMIGQDGKDFNQKYKDSGSFYLGKFNRIALQSQNMEYGIENEISNELVTIGFQDGMKGNCAIKMKDLSKTKELYYDMAKRAYPRKLISDGVKFLEENKKNPSIQVTESGLQYEILKMGSGSKPTEFSQVKVHYHGTTPEGVVFDSSVERGEPSSFGLNQVISGWTEGLQLMPEGSKFKFYIPQELAYGANPRPGSPIQPYMPLVFEVELLEIIN